MKVTQRILAGTAILFSCLLWVGCSSSEPSNMMEGASAEDLADYDAMIAADANQMSEGDSEDTSGSK